MAKRTVEDAFTILYRRLAPAPGESTAAKTHRASIGQCMKKHFGLVRYFQSGSFGRGTSVRGFSDVDRFAVLPAREIRPNSGRMLEVVRDALVERFPLSGVRVSCPGVRIPFGIDGAETTEIIPAARRPESPKHPGVPIFAIADCAGGWIATSPGAHSGFVRGVHDARGQRVKPLIRFAKAWKYRLDAPVSSFYLEMRIATWARRARVMAYDEAFCAALHHLLENGLADLVDPMGISGRIPACRTPVQKQKALSRLETAAGRATKAIAARRRGREDEAFHWWSILLGGAFPARFG